MTSQYYLLRKIAIALKNNSVEDSSMDDSYFYFKTIPFIKSGHYDFEQLSQDLKNDKEFSLKILKPEDGSMCETLYIGFSRWSNKNINRDSRFRILSLVFENVAELSLKEVNLEKDKIPLAKCFYITSRLYEMLREAHNSEDLFSEAPTCVQHNLLAPKLRPYQSKAVQWLLYREKTSEKIPQIFEAIRCSELPEQQFFLNNLDLDVLDFDPRNISFPSGGILADEMGLGKTVEMLALILLNPRSISEEYFLSDQTNKRKRDNNEIYCVCPNKKRRNIVTCAKCGAIQHARCVRKYVKDSDLEHICPNCWEDRELVESGATIIVSPQAIKMQWFSEIKKHVNAPMKILKYDGISKMKWISPIDLAQYDIVLTDYNILSREIYFSTANKSNCNLRNPKSYMRVVSPLTMIRWWRVCLDEAQMVESSTRQNSLMVKTLPTIHRWAVTGTPIQKSIDDIRGLLEFLDVVPFYEKSTFGSLVSLFHAGDTQPLLDVLQKIMWRTCKSAVLDELGIPPQSEEVHYVLMSDVEKLFYQSQHVECATAFEEKAMKLAAHSTPFSKMDPRTLNLLLDPLKKIRQDCSVPLLLQKTEQNSVKKLLQPKELLEHLKSTNEIECKGQLRTIASCYNGMAALHFMKGEIAEAIKLYEAVLRRAKEYTGAVSVDSLLQIHAIHNLAEAYETCAGSNIKLSKSLESYKEQCTKLEWKYIETYYSNLQKSELNHSSYCKAVADAEKTLNTQEIGNWWRFIWHVVELNHFQEQLIARINEERASMYSNSAYENFSSFYGIDYFLTVWFEKVLSTRHQVIDEFEHFREFKENVKPKNELSQINEEKINAFVKKAFECHLNINLTSKKESKNKPKKLCVLCRAKKVLNSYECLIFDKILVDNTESTEGSWNPTFQETTMKVIFQFAKTKRIAEEHVREGENYLHLIDSIKKEYKELGKVWIETEYTVKAYDELNMCKLRLQSIAPEKMKDKENKSAYIISEEEVDQNFMELRSQLQIAEITFVRKSARLKYIEHLASNTDPGICPICNLKPDSKYSVLECGHHLCFECLTNLRKYQRNMLTCSVCRNQQKYEDIYFVTCKPTSSSSDKTEIRGHYSSKVEEVIRTVLELQKKEKGVKILIFSQWEPILRYIAKALNENGVSYKLRSNTNTAIDEFKDEKLEITCLLLLLALGSKGLNLTEATHVFLVEPILNPGEELQAISRIHRIGQTKPTTVHRFICKDTVEEQIFNTVSKDNTKKWELNDITIDNIRVLFSTNSK